MEPSGDHSNTVSFKGHFSNAEPLVGLSKNREFQANFRNPASGNSENLSLP